MGNCLVFDIETGPSPWEEIGQFFEEPKKLGEFDPASVKYGNAKDEAKRAAIYEKARGKYVEALRNWDAELERAKADFLDKAALSPITGQVLAIGYCRLQLNATEPGGVLIKVDSRPEQDLLRQFWAVYDKYQANRGRVIGHNVFGFDLPFIARRCWRHGIAVPESAIMQKGWNGIFADTMKQWGCAIYGERVSLDTLARYFAIGGKPDGVTGADFGRLWNGTEEEKAKAIDYLRNDLELTWKVAEKMGMIV